ncbi:siderophore amonabactin TonB-dependent receptor [Niveibacterium umoris]|uniref:Iron complex outermembrane receptor protein n=1 Tax=Niveibacterium umoris TaxID=1193620 RepID=A0A840BDX7_9RHOO|nr:TonB-dependent receptor [Niveibacterium umoris]MBB4011230.1 iron complex outermembrane receptor protein [Niveibacterium umoris]
MHLYARALSIAFLFAASIRIAHASDSAAELPTPAGNRAEHVVRLGDVSPTNGELKNPDANPAVKASNHGGKSPAARQDDKAKIETIVVTGKKATDTDARRDSTAAKMVFGREELDRHGDTSLGDVLKRLPGITVGGTPGRGGEIRMRGLGNGYTLILLNGEPAPRGFSLDSLAPEQVERIEVMRAPVAEHSARAIAGTINIVLREDFVKKLSDVRPTLAWENGHFQPSISMQHNDTSGNLSYGINANVYQRDQGNESTTLTTVSNRATGAPTLRQIETTHSDTTGEGVHLSARLNWKLEGGDNLFVQPFLMHSVSTNHGDSHLAQTLGAAPPPYADASWQTQSNNTMLRVMGNWRHKLDSASRLELRANGGIASNTSDTARKEFDATGTQIHDNWNSIGIRDSSLSAAGKYSRFLGDGHSLSAGLELEGGRRDESARTIQDGVPQLAQYGDSVQARTTRWAGYAQDEWEISPLWSMYAGLRWEALKTHSQWLSGTADNSASVLSPLFHSVWKFSEESKDQARLGITRSFKSPTLAQLVPRPTLASGYPAGGPNTPTNPDSAGNPNLEPELAWGLDLAFEHYLDNGGLFSVSAFQRNIDKLIRNVTSLQSVDWSPVPRWVSTPQNIGKAVTRGIELEAKFRLSELFAEAPPLDVRANLSRFWSSVESVPGPNNRLDQQPKSTANVGLDYRFRSVPLTVGGNMNWTPSYTVQQTETQTYDQGLKRVYDVYGLWRFNPDLQLRLSASNLLQADYLTATGFTTSTELHQEQSIARTFANYSARLEVHF